MAGIEVSAFDATSEAPGADKDSEWSCRSWLLCQVPSCHVTCQEASELANHYSIVHSSSLDLSIPPTIVAPITSESESDAGGKSGDESRGNDQWPGLQCPFAGCGLCIASYPGMVMHYRRAHGGPIPASQRREISAVYCARRQNAASASDLSAVSASTSMLSSAIMSDSFVCPFSGCEVTCSSRDDIIAHFQLTHAESQSIKQEKDDAASVPK